MFTLLTLASTLGLSYLLWSLGLLLQNRSAARASGLPFFYHPFADSKNWYLIIAAPPVIWLIEKLPSNIASYVYSSSYVTRWKAKYRGVHAKVGDVCLMVSSGTLSCYVADAKAAEEIFANRTKFVKPSHNFEHLKLFGNNVLACDENDWRHHRRYTGPPFNERNNVLVWKETISQASDMLEQWKTSSKDPAITATSDGFTYARLQNVPNRRAGSFFDSSRSDFRKLALHIISAAGFGVSLPFSAKDSNTELEGKRDGSLFSDTAKPPQGFYRTFRESLEYITINLVLVVALLQALPKFVLEHSPFSALRAPIEIIHDIEAYVNALIELARKDTDATNFERSGNLLSSLVQSGTENKQTIGGNEDGGESKQTTPFTNRDIMGNIFIFSIAGHETTASTLQFALTMLALHPEQQDWLLRKLDAELAGTPESPQNWDYQATYERLASVRCLMFETLRLFPPLAGIAKWAEHSQPLTLSDGSTHQLPPKLWITVNCAGLHYNPKYWGPTVNEFDPSRWDATNKKSFLRSVHGNPNKQHQMADAPGLYRPVAGSWIAFSEGPRSCLGRKFAMVEFVATMAVLLRKYKVELALKTGEGSMQQARERVQRVVDNASGFTALVMQEDIGMVLKER